MRRAFPFPDYIHHIHRTTYAHRYPVPDRRQSMDQKSRGNREEGRELLTIPVLLEDYASSQDYVILPLACYSSLSPGDVDRRPRLLYILGGTSPHGSSSPHHALGLFTSTKRYRVAFIIFGYQELNVRGSIWHLLYTSTK